jgi:hypothetical protein
VVHGRAVSAPSWSKNSGVLRAHAQLTPAAYSWYYFRVTFELELRASDTELVTSAWKPETGWIISTTDMTVHQYQSQVCQSAQ